MSRNINRTRARTVLLIAANPSISTTLGWPVGCWASEVIHAWYEFREAGYEVVIASPDGGAVEIDALSDPRDPSGYSAEDVLSRGFLETPACTAQLAATPSLAQLELSRFDALYVAGGQSPMFTFRGHERLGATIRAFHDSGRPTALVCHATCALLGLRLGDGTPLVRGRHMTGFANSEEDFADQVVGRRVMPFRIEEEARALGAHFTVAPAFREHAVRDANLITGQQQYSGRLAAALVIESLGR